MAFIRPIQHRLYARPFTVIPGGKALGPRSPEPDGITRQYRTWEMRRFVVRCASLAILTAAAIVGCFYAATSQSDWDRLTILRHVAAPNCEAARTVGLAPARRGEPGYYAKHDRDQDSIACEVWPRR